VEKQKEEHGEEIERGSIITNHCCVCHKIKWVS